MGKKEEESPGPDQACTSVSSLINYPWGPVEERRRDNGPTGPFTSLAGSAFLALA